MTTWWHHPTILTLRFDRRLVLRVSCILLLCIALITTLFFGVVSHAAPGVNQTLGFQGRLLDSNGDIVHDGSYNMQFKIYQGGTGTAAGNPGGTLKWTETYVNNGNATGAVEVKNGFMSVNLGSINAFGSQVDWNQDTLWLSMNVAGSSTACTTFNTSPCGADGEMLPMKRLTATPFAMNAGAVNGKTADNFIQLAQGVQTDASLNTPSIFVNKTGTGNLLQLQTNGNNALSVTGAGDIEFGSGATRAIYIGNAGTNANGDALVIHAGYGGDGTGNNGGGLFLQGGAGGGTNSDGGSVGITGGTGTGTGKSGSVYIGSTDTDAIQIGAKNDTTISTNGTQQARFSSNSNTLYVGNADFAGNAASANGFSIQGTSSTNSNTQGGSLNLQAGSATNGDANGGNLTLSGGSGSGTGTSGLVVINTPTFATSSNDANCYTNGATVTASCTITGASVNNTSAIIVGFSAAGKTATVPDPTNTTAGRIIYVTAANGSKDFALSINGGGKGNETTMRQNTTSTLLWNGSDWTIAGATNYGVNTTDNVENIQIGSGTDDGTSTLLTLDKSATAPTVTDQALLGSMYYDTTIGKVQCYEADGWGACSSSPDTFVSLSPEYANSVKNGNGIGTMASDFCSDALNINDGSFSQPAICATNETYNYYSWNSAETASQIKSVYVTYQLPSNFKQFVSGSTSLMARTDSSNAAVAYEIYRNNGSGLQACGTTEVASTGVQSTWKKSVVSSTADPSNCSFSPGDSLIIRVALVANSGANAYASNLNFAYSNQ